MREIIGNIIQANKVFNFIKNNDKIAVGVSGGKDSLVLLQAMSFYCKKMKENFNWNIKIKGFLVDLGFKYQNYSSLKKWCKKHNLLLEIIKSDIAKVLEVKKEKGKIQCSLCSKMKKAILIREIKKQGFNKLAYGHHIDDAIETLFMNIFNQGRIAIFQPSIYLDHERIYLIRPLIMCREKQIIAICKRLQMPIIKWLCPNEANTQRTFMKNFINDCFYKNTKYWPNIYINLYRSLFNKEGCDLWFLNSKYKINNLWSTKITTKKHSK